MNNPLEKLKKTGISGGKICYATTYLFAYVRESILFRHGREPAAESYLSAFTVQHPLNGAGR